MRGGVTLLLLLAAMALAARAYTAKELSMLVLAAFNEKNETAIGSFLAEDATLRVVPDSCTPMGKSEYLALLWAFFNYMTGNVEFVAAETLETADNMTVLVVQNLAVRGGLSAPRRGVGSGAPGGFWWSDKYIVVGQASADGRTLRRFDIYENAGPPKQANYSVTKEVMHALAAAQGNASMPADAIMSDFFLPSYTSTLHRGGAAAPPYTLACNYTCAAAELADARAQFSKYLAVHVDRVVASCNVAAVQQTVFARNDITGAEWIQRQVAVYELAGGGDYRVASGEIWISSKVWRFNT